MLYDKPATTIAEQANLLVERGMACENADLVERWLRTVGYYRLSAYWLAFEKRPTAGKTRSKAFVEGTTFESVTKLYMFDRRLRLMVLEGIERIEISLRSRWTNRLALAHGPHAHMTEANFRPWDEYRRLFYGLTEDVARSRETFIAHYRLRYDSPPFPPLWAVSETMSFGQLSKWVQATADGSIRSALASDLGLPTSEALIGTLQSLAFVRNVAAHQGRLWDRRIVKRLPRIKRIETYFVYQHGNPTVVADTIYNSLAMIAHLLRHQADDTTYPARMKELVATTTGWQQRAMGFPKNWSERPIWN